MGCSSRTIVENKPGADGILSALEVMRAPPDGYTILMGTNTAMVAVTALRPNPPYDLFKAFTRPPDLSADITGKLSAGLRARSPVPMSATSWSGRASPAMA